MAGEGFYTEELKEFIGFKDIQVEYYYTPGEPDEPYDRYGEPGTQGTAHSAKIQRIWVELNNDQGSSTVVDVADIWPISTADIEEEILEKYHGE